MASLKDEVLKNSGFSGAARSALATWLEAVETVLGEHEALAEDIATQYAAHCADDTAHNSADVTNAVTKSIATTLSTITDA